MLDRPGYQWVRIVDCDVLQGLRSDDSIAELKRTRGLWVRGARLGGEDNREVLLINAACSRVRHEADAPPLRDWTAAEELQPLLHMAGVRRLGDAE